MKSVNPMLGGDVRHSEWLPLLDTAVREVFELMLSSHLTTPTAPETGEMDTTAMVGLAGQLCGVLSVRCQRKAASLMTSKMLGVPMDKVDPEISDALGEICNMVAGNFKNKITGLAEGCMLSPPTVISGSDYVFTSLTDSPGLDVNFLFEGFPLVVTLDIHN